MARPLWLVNMLLFLLAIALAYGIVHSFLERQEAREEARAVTRGAREAAQAAEQAGTPLKLGTSNPPLSDFDIIVGKETFKNPFAVQRPPQAAPPPPPPPPLPALVGTMFIGEERRAVLVENAKSQIYKVGQPVAGGTLVEIEADRVTIERNGSKEVVLLKASMQPAPPGGPRPGRSPATRSQPAPVVAPPPRPVTTQPGAAAVPPAAETGTAPSSPGTRNILRRSGR